MRSSEECKFRIIPELSSKLWRIIECYVGRERAASLQALYDVVGAASANGFELLLVPKHSSTLVLRYCGRVYTAGLHVASVRGSKLLLNLSLGQLLEKGISRGYIVLPEPLVKKILYGKPLLVNPAGLEYRPGCKPLAVLDNEHDFVAWAEVSPKDSKLLIKPLIDAGWYLRSGV